MLFGIGQNKYKEEVHPKADVYTKEEVDELIAGILPNMGRIELIANIGSQALAGAKITALTEVYNNNNFTVSSGNFTCLKAGWYRLKGQISFSLSTAVWFRLWINGAVSAVDWIVYGNSFQSCNVEWVGYLNENDTFYFKNAYSNTSQVTGGGVSGGQIYIEKLYVEEN